MGCQPGANTATTAATEILLLLKGVAGEGGILGILCKPLLVILRKTVRRGRHDYLVSTLDLTSLLSKLLLHELLKGMYPEPMYIFFVQKGTALRFVDHIRYLTI